MVGIAIHNEVKTIDDRYQLQTEGSIICKRDLSMFEVSQSNSKFNVPDTLTVVVHLIRMPVGFGGNKGRSLSVMAHLKKSIIEVKAETNCSWSTP